MRQAALLVAVVCVLAVPLAGAAGVTGVTASTAQQDTPASEEVDITVQLEPDGDARWNVSATYALDDENDTAAFEQLAQEFKAGQTDNGFSVDVFRAAVPAVSEEVERGMEIRNDRRTATTIEHANNSTGVLSLQFTWTNFSRVTNETMLVDGFSGGWFGDLQDRQTLTIRPPEGYDPDTVDPQTSVVDGAYQWEGGQAFQSGQPTLVFTESPSGGPGFDVDSLLTAVAVGGVLFLVGGVLVWAVVRRDAPVAALFGRGDEDESATSGTASETAARRAGGPTDDAAIGPEGSASSASGGDGATAGGVDPELLSDEERVERLLREHDGRMKQSKIVEETRWSTAKVSQLLSSMDDDGRIEKLRIGRENLISLPGEGVNDE